MVNRNFSDLFAAFNEADVNYLLIGAHAVAFYAAPRYTKDLDVGSRCIARGIHGCVGKSR